ncbi:MAG: sensor histidine kinase [Saprospiraceae bacterium]|nr:sensor histidine kinase [Saprospiraceae bacterium]
MLRNIHTKTYFHLAAWLGFLLIILFSADELDRLFILKSFSSFIPPFFLFYCLIFWVFPNFLGKGNDIKSILLTSSLTIAMVFMRPLFTLLFPEELNIPFDRITFWVQLRYNILFVAIAFGYHYASELIKGDQERQLLEKENTAAKLALLKHQINPHFLYNTLSMIYTKALPLSEDLADMIAKLSGMLRYSITETDSEGLVPLQNEIQFIQQYISMNEARFNKIGHCQFIINGELQSYKIAPLLLISFVENAYKHGDLTQPIIMELITEGDKLFFSIENKIAKGAKDYTSGIGLDNIKNRLEMLYKNRYTLSINSLENNFKVELKLW